MCLLRRYIPVAVAIVIAAQLASIGEGQQQMDWWGLPDAVAPAGKLFEYRLDQLTDVGNDDDDDVDFGSATDDQRRAPTFDVYQVYESGQRHRHRLPEWLLWTEERSLLEGVPRESLVGTDYVIMVSGQRAPGEPPVTDQFVLRVVADKLRPSYGHGYTVEYAEQPVGSGHVVGPVQCPPVSAVTTATLVLDADLDWMDAIGRVHLVRHVAQEFQLPASLFRLQVPPTDRPLMDTASALAAGPGDLGAERPYHVGLLVEWDVGCGNVRAGLMPSLELLETTAGDGRLRRAVDHPVVGWYVTNRRRGAGSRRRDPKHAVWPPHPTATPLTPTAIRPTWRPDLPTATVSVEPTPTAAWTPSPTAPHPPEQQSSTSTTPEPETTTWTEGHLEPSQPPVAMTTRSSLSSTPSPPLPITTRRRHPPIDVNRKPYIRNPIGRIEVMMGNVLCFEIPANTFYDPEDGDTSNLQLVFMTLNDDLTVAPDSWIQLNQTSRTLYGLPLSSDVGRHEFLLAAADRLGRMARMAFEVSVTEIYLRQRLTHEFSVTLDLDYTEFLYKVERRINLTKRIAHAFGDPGPGLMTVTRIEPGSVVFAWTNNSLPTDTCPAQQIGNLSERIQYPNRQPNHDFIVAMRPFRVTAVDVTPLGSCAKATTTSAAVDVSTTPKGPVVSGLTTDEHLFLLVIIAVAIIAVLLVIIIIIAIVCCCRRRRRRPGDKQRTAGDDELSCTNKGIPVIFADELLDDNDDEDDEKVVDDDTPASTLKRRRGGDEPVEDRVPPETQPPPPDYPRSDPASRTSTLRSDYKAALVSSDDDDDDDERRQLMTASDAADTLPAYNDNKLNSTTTQS